ncbi:MAG TPA: 30S ribosomal protein S15 [Lentisphaeria bacterium]|nr:MAG: 30S ribosomal protein S15 [Lentisphaerae bacterium GWF2_50_93]HCE42597.1 30S ribosomal protein S15 [Lentisphaeria bacterium]
MNESSKKNVIEKYGRKKGDTGSPEVQIAIMTERINELTGHLKDHKKDFSSRKGLSTLVSKRRKLLSYLNEENHERYQSLTEELNIRKAK